jgi:gamma-glutamylaminecyclotransferase
MKIFIYGTLKSNCSNHSFFKKFIKENSKKKIVRTVEEYPMYKLDSYFPYLENSPGIGKEIIGELYEIDEKKLYMLDYFEGVPDLYQQGYITVIDNKLNIYKNILVYFKTEKLNDYSKIKFLSEWIE